MNQVTFGILEAQVDHAACLRDRDLLQRHGLLQVVQRDIVPEQPEAHGIRFNGEQSARLSLDHLSQHDGIGSMVCADLHYGGMRPCGKILAARMHLDEVGIAHNL
jgi:hypothetical protein